MKTVNPLGKRIDDVMAEHQTLGCAVVAIAGAVGFITVCFYSKIIIRYGFLKRKIFRNGCYVHIHNNRKAGFMKCLNHTFAFTDCLKGIIFIR